MNIVELFEVTMPRRTGDLAWLQRNKDYADLIDRHAISFDEALSNVSNIWFVRFVDDINVGHGRTDVPLLATNIRGPRDSRGIYAYPLIKELHQLIADIKSRKELASGYKNAYFFRLKPLPNIYLHHNTTQFITDERGRFIDQGRYPDVESREKFNGLNISKNGVSSRGIRGFITFETNIKNKTTQLWIPDSSLIDKSSVFLISVPMNHLDKNVTKRWVKRKIYERIVNKFNESENEIKRLLVNEIQPQSESVVDLFGLTFYYKKENEQSDYEIICKLEDRANNFVHPTFWCLDKRIEEIDYFAHTIINYALYASTEQFIMELIDSNADKLLNEIARAVLYHGDPLGSYYDRDVFSIIKNIIQSNPNH